MRSLLGTGRWSLSHSALAFVVAMSLSVMTIDVAKAEVSYAGKQIEWIIPSAPGGGTDTSSRILAPWFEKHLPGNPTIILRNIPGAGTISGINYFWDHGGPDGNMILMVTTGAQTNYLFGVEEVAYELPKFISIMGIPQGTFVYAQSSLGLDGPEDIGKLVESGKTYSFGAQTPTSAEARMLIAWNALGVKTQPVWGLARGESRQGFMRKEFDLMYDTASGWVAAGRDIDHKTALFTFGVEDENGNIVRDPVQPDLPTFLEVYEQYKGKKLDGLVYKAWYAMFSTAVMNSKAVVLHPKTSPEVLATYQAAVKRMLDDPEFQAAMKEELGGYRLNIGKAAQNSLASSASVEPEVCAWFETFFKNNYDTEVNCRKE